MTYKYDALGRRVQRSPSSGVSTNFSYDDADVVRDKNSDATTVDYLNGQGIDNKIWQKGAAQYFFSQDNLGGTSALTNASGVLVERETYDSYGNASGSALTRYGYTGRERDSVTGLLYYRARFYDPQVGRFISEDPAGLIAGINPYVYVGNDSIQWADPSGLCRCGIRKGPEYFIHAGFHTFGGSYDIGGGSIPAGTKIYWHAEFLNDATHDPKCCEVRQLISWNKGPFGPNTVPHQGFPSWAGSGTWLEDRNEHNRRYGRRTINERYADPLTIVANDYHDSEYDSSDQPGVGWTPGDTIPGFALRFRLIVIDICRGGRRVYASKTITVNF